MFLILIVIVPETLHAAGGAISPGGASSGAGGSPSPMGDGQEEERRILLMKQDLARQIEENRKLLEEINKKLVLYQSLKKKNVRNLVKLYESMAPRTAASQIDVMSKTLRLTLFSGMNPRKASRIMRYVDPRVAAEISAQMAGMAPTAGGGQ
ncbi:MAG: MotE family protein [Leptospirillia bacterium]